MKRRIEIFARMNMNGYEAGMKVDGREFSARNTAGEDLSKVTVSIGEQIENVYGQYMRRYWEYEDLHDAYCSVLGIAAQMHALHKRLTAPPERRHEML